MRYASFVNERGYIVVVVPLATFIAMILLMRSSKAKGLMPLASGLFNTDLFVIATFISSLGYQDSHLLTIKELLIKGAVAIFGIENFSSDGAIPDVIIAISLKKGDLSSLMPRFVVITLASKALLSS